MPGTRVGYLGPEGGIQGAQGPQGSTGAPTIDVANAAALTALNVSVLGDAQLARVETYKDFFFLDKITVRTAIPDEVIASSSPTAWWVRMHIVDLFWAIQAVWFIDPVNGNNENNGATLATAIQTRAELFRRMSGVTLTQIVSVFVTSSLLAGDVFKSHVISGPFAFLDWIGTRTNLVLPANVVTAVVNRNGSTGTHTSLTVAGMGSWTPYVGKVVTNGTAYSRVIQDEGADTAWFSPPVSILGAQSETTFAVNNVLIVYDVPSLGTNDTVFDQVVRYNDLKVSGRFFFCPAENQLLVNCTGDVVAKQTCLSIFNGHTVSGISEGLVVQGGKCDITGGWHRGVPSYKGVIVVNWAATWKGLQIESGGQIASKVPLAAPFGAGLYLNTDIELNAIDVGNPGIWFIFPGDSTLNITGYTYGVCDGPFLLRFDTQDCRAVFAQQPVVTGVNATIISSGRDQTTQATTTLPNQAFTDSAGNVVAMPSGMLTLDRESLYRFARGIAAETVDRTALSTGSFPISGTLHFMQLLLLKGQVISSSSVLVSAQTINAVGLTFSKVGLFSKTGVLLASCANQVAAWASPATHSQAFTAPYVVPTTNVYYVGFLIITGGTMPALVKSAGPPAAIMAGQSDAAPSGGIFCGSQAGLADLPNPATIAIGPTPGFFWIGLS
jgi:hypothetical protein